MTEPTNLCANQPLFCREQSPGCLTSAGQELATCIQDLGRRPIVVASSPAGTSTHCRLESQFLDGREVHNFVPKVIRDACRAVLDGCKDGLGVSHFARSQQFSRASN